MKLLVTGGAGFIGSNFIRYWLKKYPNDSILNLDKLTYAGNPYGEPGKEKPANLRDLEENPNLKFVKFDITCPIDTKESKIENDPLKKVELEGRFDRKKFLQLVDFISESDAVVHFAAESHVDRSLLEKGGHPTAFEFVISNVYGTHIMLEAAVKAWQGKMSQKRFHHVSTDEVFGTLQLGEKNKFNELTRYAPRSPYAASKASADHLVRAYNISFGLPTTISNTENNYGPYLYPEKLLSLAITNLLEGKKVPIYGEGKNVRDWLYVEDHCFGIDLILKKGKPGETYCIGGLTQDINNLQLIKKVLVIMGKDENYIEFVKDRPGHDLRYAIDWSKAERELGYRPQHDLDTYLVKMINWYKENEQWWKQIKSGKLYKEYYRKQYELR